MGNSAVKIASTLLLVLLASSCGRGTLETVYQLAWTAYVKGDLRGAADQASRGIGRARDRQSPWFWKFRLLEAEVLIDQSKGDQAASLLTESVPSEPQLSQLEQRRLIDLAYLKSRRKSDAAEAVRILNQARAALSPDSELLIRFYLVSGIVAYSQGTMDLSNKAFQEAQRLAELRGDSYWQVQALNNLSSCSRSQRRYEEAIELGLRALALADGLGARRIAALIHGNLGSSYSFLGDFESSTSHELKAVALLEAIGAQFNLMIALNELGVMYDRAGNLSDAVANYRRAYEIATDLKETAHAQRYAGNLSLTFLKFGQWSEAEKWNDRAFDLTNSTNKGALPYLIRNRAWIAYGRGRSEEAAQICREILRDNPDDPSVQWATYQLLGLIDANSKRLGEAAREFESALQIIERTRSELLNADNRVTLLSRLISFYQDYVEALVHNGDDAGALRVIESSRARVLAERLGRSVKQSQFAGLASFRRFAGESHSVLLEYWLTPRQSFAWLVTASGVRRFDLPPAPEIEKLVSAYRSTLEQSLRDPIETNDAAAAKLWNILLAPIAPEIPKDSRVIVIPDGALHRLNLETLVVPTPQPHYWIEDVEVAIAPSIAIAATKRAAETRHQPSLLVIGAPDYSGTSYAPLEKAESEVRGIQARFSSARVLTGRDASPAAYREADPGRYSLIHFTAHAEANSERPLESAVILSRHDTQYKLYARDVIDIPIHADLVTLSACHSAGARTYNGEGLIGFAWAFLQAGAHAVVGGLWDVSDSSTGPLMSGFYGDIAEGRDPVHSLRAAKLDLLRNYPRFRRPYYWGPFQLYLGAAR
jgi:CHAT domain-containing protein